MPHPDLHRGKHSPGIKFIASDAHLAPIQCGFQVGRPVAGDHDNVFDPIFAENHNGPLDQGLTVDLQQSLNCPIR